MARVGRVCGSLTHIMHHHNTHPLDLMLTPTAVATAVFCSNGWCCTIVTGSVCLAHVHSLLLAPPSWHHPPSRYPTALIPQLCNSVVTAVGARARECVWCVVRRVDRYISPRRSIGPALSSLNRRITRTYTPWASDELGIGCRYCASQLALSPRRQFSQSS